MQGELKVRELERFKACYCGLCHALGKRYGLTSRFILNYEFVFLSMLLWDDTEQPIIKQSRCPASPLRKKRFCAPNAALETCAGYSIILTWWKLKDTITDEPLLKALPHRILSLVLLGAYRKAAREYPEFDKSVRDEVASLSEYESRAARSLDGAADMFAKALCAAAPASVPDEKKRPMMELLYHLGRWVYILDACDDYNEDIKAGRYNPVAARYPPKSGKIPDAGIAALKITLTHSNNLLCLAFELLPENVWSDIIENMVYLGMPYVCEQVIMGNKIKGTGILQ